MSSLESNFNREVRKLVIPSVMQMIVGNSFSFINTLMVGGLGDTAVAITAAAGQVSFILGMLLSAVFGISAYITQFYGKQNTSSARKAFALMLVSALSVSSVAAALVWLLKIPVLSLFIHDRAAAAAGGAYLSVMAFVFVVNAMKDAYGNALGAVGQVKPNLYIGLFAMAVNVILDYTLIYGKCGFSAFGIRGAAIATLAASMLGAVAMLLYVYRTSALFNVSLRDLLHLDFSFARSVYRTTLPLIVHEGAWSVGNMLYAVAFGHMGVAVLAAYQLARTFKNYFMMGIFGFAYAAKVMIGKKLGKDDPGEAVDYARRFTRLSVYSAIAVSIGIVLCTPFIVRLFPHLSPDVRTSFRHMMHIQSLVLVMYFLNNVWIVGMFRAGGDNVYTMKLIVWTTWFIALPLVFAGVYVFRWPAEAIYFLFTLEEVSKAVIGYFRYRSGKWAKNLVHHI